jgi:glycine cleavage system transcriptional repressor
VTSPSSHAVTVLGHDRPGIVADVTARLGDLGLNLEDSSMTLLRGRFAMTLVCRGEASTEALRDALHLGDDLTVAVVALPDDTAPPAAAVGWVLTVHGADRAGIVSAVTAEVARAGGNLTDLTTRLSAELYVLVAEVELPEGIDAEALRASVGAAAERLGVVATLRPADPDDL